MQNLITAVACANHSSQIDDGWGEGDQATILYRKYKGLAARLLDHFLLFPPPASSIEATHESSSDHHLAIPFLAADLIPSQPCLPRS